MYWRGERLKFSIESLPIRVERDFMVTETIILEIRKLRNSSSPFLSYSTFFLIMHLLQSSFLTQNRQMLDWKRNLWIIWSTLHVWLMQKLMSKERKVAVQGLWAVLASALGFVSLVSVQVWCHSETGVRGIVPYQLCHHHKLHDLGHVTHSLSVLWFPQPEHGLHLLIVLLWEICVPFRKYV